MHILVTGGAGFIGSFTVDRLIGLGHKVRILDNLDEQVHPDGREPDYLNKKAEFIKGDVRDYEAFSRALDGIEVVFHLAACVGVGQSQYMIRKYTDVSIGGTANLLDILVNKKNRVKKIIVAASMSSYGEGLYGCKKCGGVRPPLRPEKQLKAREWEPKCPKCGREITPMPINEEESQHCNSIYAITKKVQEEMVLNIGMTYNIPSVAIRYFNVYGPRQSLSNPYTGVSAIFISRVKNDHPPVVYEDGRQTRDFISVHDIADLNVLVMQRKEADYQSFNAGSGRPLAIKDIARTIIKLAKKDLKPEIVNKYRKGDVRHCFADASKLKKVLGFSPKVSFEDGLKELMEWSEKTKADDKFEKARRELKEKGLVE